MKVKLIRKTDVLIVAFLLVICLVLILPKLFSNEKLTAKIYQNGKTVETIDLREVSDSYEIKLDGAVILVEHNAISFVSASCPDKLCVKCGKLSHAGDTAVCVPTATVITVSGNSKKQVDAISY